MQQHPVPRNVTTFQFKLVGDMTLKQFGYLAVGAILGYISFRVVPGPVVIKFMIGIIFGSSGAAFAFAPIQGRPLDTWLMAFIKSVTSPTRFGWEKTRSLPLVMEPSFKFGAVNISSSEMKNVEDKLNSYLTNKKKLPHELIDENEKKALHKTNSALVNVSKGAIISTQANLGRRLHLPHSLPTDAILDNTIVSSSDIKPVGQTAKNTPLFHSLPRSIEDILQEKSQHQEPHTTANTQRVNHETIEVLEATAATAKGFVSAPTQPNVLSAVVLDISGKPLSDILVVIKNESKMIVRALKSNALGQVISNTPLSNGVYYIELEDPNGHFIFDIIKATLKGGIFQPIQIQAKQVNYETNDIRKKLFST